MARKTKAEKYAFAKRFNKKYRHFLKTKNEVAEMREELDEMTGKQTTIFEDGNETPLKVKYKTSHSTKYDIDGFCEKYGIDRGLFDEFKTVTYYPVFDGIE